MDSLTQLALGAAVGEATLGRKAGRRAMLWGAICGTLPDLDVFVPLGDPVRDFTYHRSASHSLFVLAAVTPLLVWLILRLHPQTARHWRGWLALVYLAFATHVLLDSLTVYGTQILWPFDKTPVAWSTVFIIDPAYTLPLLLGVFAALTMRRPPARGWRLNALGLVFSTLYLAWSVAAKLHVQQRGAESLARHAVVTERLLVAPAPFNTALWRLVAVTDERYYEGFFSYLDGTGRIEWTEHPRHPALLRGLEEAWAVRRLQWFTKGFYAVAAEHGDIVMSDLRMGLEPDFFFRFRVGEIANPHARPAPSMQLPIQRDLGRLRWVWARIFAPLPSQAGGNGPR